MKRILLVLAVLLPVLTGCRNREAGTPQKDFTFSGETVRINPESPVASELRVEAVSTSAFEAAYHTTGNIQPRAGSYAEVAVPFAGRITRALVRLGDYVRAGQPLFEMSSSEFFEVVREHFENEVAMRNAEANLKRREATYEAGYLSEREIEEARAEAENARNAWQMSRMALSVFHVDLDRLKVGEPIRVTAPISGRIVSCNLTPGQYVKEDAEPLAAVAELSRVWISAHLSEWQATRVGKESHAEIRTNDGDVCEASIVYVGEMLDTQTQTAEVMLECPNPDHRLMPGMFVSVEFHTPREEAILIPATAVFQGENAKYVYVETEPLKFERRPVVVESAGTEQVHVVSGLSVDERIIADGGIYLSE